MRLTPTRLPFRKTLWKLGVGVLLFIVTAAVTSQFLPPDKQLGAGPFGNDLMPSYVAGRMVAEGRGDAMYNPYAVSDAVWETWATSYPQEKARHGMAPWLNPPFYALVFVPLAMLPYPLALAVWVGVNATLLVVGCALLIRLLPAGVPWSVKGLVPLLVMTAFPFVQATTHQQNTFLSLAILAGALVLTVGPVQSSWRAYAAGAVAGLLFFKPQLGLVVVIAIAVVLGYRALIGAAVVGTLLLAAGEWAVPGSVWSFMLEMPRAVAEVQARGGYKWSRQITLLSFWQTLFHGELGGAATGGAKVLYAISAAAVIGAIGWSSRHMWQTTDLATARRWLAAAICAMPLVMPYYMDYDLLLLAAAVALLAGDVLVTGEPLTAADRRLTWTWVAFSAWLLFQPPMAAGWRVNVSVVMLVVLTAMMARRVRRPVTIATTTTDVAGPNPAPARLAA